MLREIPSTFRIYPSSDNSSWWEKKAKGNAACDISGSIVYPWDNMYRNWRFQPFISNHNLIQRDKNVSKWARFQNFLKIRKTFLETTTSKTKDSSCSIGRETSWNLRHGTVRFQRFDISEQKKTSKRCLLKSSKKMMKRRKRVRWEHLGVLVSFFFCVKEGGNGFSFSKNRLILSFVSASKIGSCVGWLPWGSSYMVRKSKFFRE